MRRRTAYPDGWFTAPVRAWFGRHWRPAIEPDALSPKIDAMLAAQRKQSPIAARTWQWRIAR